MEAGHLDVPGATLDLLALIIEAFLFIITLFGFYYGGEHGMGPRGLLIHRGGADMPILRPPHNQLKQLLS